MGFHHVGQAGLKLLALTDSPASASQNAGIIGVIHQCVCFLLFDEQYMKANIVSSLGTSKDELMTWSFGSSA